MVAAREIRHVFFFNDTATTEIYTLSLHDALPICRCGRNSRSAGPTGRPPRPRASRHRTYPSPAPAAESSGDPKASARTSSRSEEHTSELQSRQYLVCRLLLEKNNLPHLLPPCRRR